MKVTVKHDRKSKLLAHVLRFPFFFFLVEGKIMIIIEHVY